MSSRFHKLLLLLVVPWFMALNAAAGDAPAVLPIIGRLLVFVNGSCTYCRQFNTEVASFYGKTRIGKRLPLSEVNIDLPDEPYERLAKGVRFIPTFVILDKRGEEQARFRGYRTEESFWADLESVFHRLECREAREGNLGPRC